ncbi:MAG: MFS transporter [Planctomycetota bacterium]|jgi:MFS family permease
MTNDLAAPASAHPARTRLLFWACFIALVATAFAFVIRAFIIGELQEQFFLTETEKGQILGAGLWPFGISIVLFSLIVDKIGYGKSMIFAFTCHVASVVVFLFAQGYWSLWSGAVLAGLAAGTVEAIVNPVVATMYPKNKTMMLTILHGGWAGGVALGGLLVQLLGDAGGLANWLNCTGWQVKMGLLLVPTALYGVMMLRCRFPVNERVAAGVPYKDMLKECGVLGMLIVAFMIVWQLGVKDLLDLPPYLRLDVVLFVCLCMAIYTQSFGRVMYSFLLLIMILLAITELGTDGWMKELRDPAMKDLGIDGGWILVYTASIMVVMRFCIAPFVKILKPLGVLLMGSIFAAVGLFTLPIAELPTWILVTATVYGIGQAFFWPVTIGIVAERFPRGGALTINAIAGVGMLGVGIIGLPLMGYLQDTHAVSKLNEAPTLAVKYVDTEPKPSFFGDYTARSEKAVNRINGIGELFDLAQKQRAVLAEANENVTDAQLAEALAASGDYVGKVRWAFDKILRAEGDVEKRSYAEMLAALTEAGIIVDAARYEAQFKDEYEAVRENHIDSARHAMQWIALLPLIMAACYLGLIIYFRATGGYRAIDLSAEGEPVGEHPVTPTEAVADAEATPSE